MDGFQGKLKHSLQYRLSVSITAGVALMALLGALMSFLLMLNEADHFQDSQLRQVAALIDSRYLPLLSGKDREVRFDDDDDGDARITVQRVPSEQGMGAGSAQEEKDVLNLPSGLQDGLQTVFIDGASWRVLVKPVAQDVRIAIAQPTAERKEVARHSAMGTLIPLALLIPCLVFLVNFLIGKMFRPVVRLAEEINRRSDQDLSALDEERVPLEIASFVSAINRLFGRVALAIEHQHRFIADAAHELRSPLTALSLQAERLAAAELPDAARERVGTLQQGIYRARALIGQLLTLARMQQAPRSRCQPVSLLSVIRKTLEELIPVAEQRLMEIEMTGVDDVMVVAQEIDLQTLIKNLLDNAIRHTPAQGRVVLHVSAENGGVLEIRDTGPGIPASERLRVFDAFYRVPGNPVPGSGLGLAIVKTIADRIGASVELREADAGIPHGLAVTVAFRQ